MSGPVPVAPEGVRLVATDLDGTLLRSDGTLSERTVATLARAHDEGLDVVLVNGRPLRWAAQVFDHVGGHGLAIVANGALLWDVDGDRAQLVRGMAPQVAVEVARAIRAEVPEAAFALESVDGFALEHAFMPRHPLAVGARRGALDEIADAEVLKLLVRHEGATAEEYAARVVEAVGERAVVTWSSSDSLLEISAAGVTKASTLEHLCRSRGLGAEHVVAFGDMPNDLAMLRWAGTGYAMANAHPSVLEAADRTTVTNDEDGVAVVVEQLLDAR